MEKPEIGTKAWFDTLTSRDKAWLKEWQGYVGCPADCYTPWDCLREKLGLTITP